jgi:AcrR family transcriptional regulator
MTTNGSAAAGAWEEEGETPASTPDRILRAAEQLFSKRGIDGVSLREIIAAAGVNSAALHYHFGSKAVLIEKLFALRAKSLAERRIALLDQVPLDADGRPVLEEVLKAFLGPALEASRTPDGMAFTLLRARMVFEGEEVKREVLGKAFDHSSGLTLQALARALPGLSPTELHWRFHFLLGSMVYTTAHPGRIEILSGGSVDTSDTQVALEMLVRYTAAGFRAV